MIDKLKLAIDTKNWQLAIEFYEQLTSKSVKAHEAVQVVQNVQPARKNGFDDFTMRPAQPTLRKKTEKAEAAEAPAKPKSRKKKQAVKAKDIQFIDTGEASDEPGFDKINDNVPPTPRKRKPFKPAIMECTVCHKKKEVAPLFKRDAEMYKCDECLVKGATGGIE